MNIIKRDYFPVYKELGSHIENMLGRQLEDASFVDTSTWAPAVDIKEEKDRFLVLADIPGVSKENINISLENNVLTLRGERYFENTEQNKDYTRKERVQGQFYRRFSLPKIADDAKISAKYKHGVLEISIPKKEQSVEKKIDIKVEE